jgi:hypothetical protein
MDFVLIDYENVQPTDVELLRGSKFKLKLFLGASQSKIPVKLAKAMHSLGADAEYVLLEASGHNALDFHLAYYIGLLSAQVPGATFRIISKDSGFDPLIKHLQHKGTVAQRHASISALPLAKSVERNSADDRVDLALTHLRKLNSAKPRTERTLRSTLHALFKKELSDDDLSALFRALCAHGAVRVDGTKVVYTL